MKCRLLNCDSVCNRLSSVLYISPFNLSVCNSLLTSNQRPPSCCYNVLINWSTLGNLTHALLRELRKWNDFKENLPWYHLSPIRTWTYYVKLKYPGNEYHYLFKPKWQAIWTEVFIRITSQIIQWKQYILQYCQTLNQISVLLWESLRVHQRRSLVS
jgi:hypothetical protein